MTSDEATQSIGRQYLDFALGKKRISLACLKPDEFDELLRGVFQGIDLRELRGFKPLKELLSKRPGSFLAGRRQNPLEHVKVSPDIVLRLNEDARALQCNLNSHFVSVTRGFIDQIVTYRRYESDEETNDWHVADSWGADGGYVRKVVETFLVLRRPYDHSRADENLFAVRYDFEKVPHKDEMIVKYIEVNRLTLGAFRVLFGKKYTQIARDLIWELELLSHQTLETLQSQVHRFQPRVVELERLSESIME